MGVVKTHHLPCPINVHHVSTIQTLVKGIATHHPTYAVFYWSIALCGLDMWLCTYHNKKQNGRPWQLQHITSNIAPAVTCARWSIVVPLVCVLHIRHLSINYQAKFACMLGDNNTKRICMPKMSTHVQLLNHYYKCII